MTSLMASSSLAASRFARVAAASARRGQGKNFIPAGTSNDRFFFSSTSTTLSSEKNLTRDDVLDSDGLLQFTTLHEMNHLASIAFKDNPLFGTYKAPLVEENVVKDQKDAQGSFEWMTYGEYGEMVNKCRTVLKDLGEYRSITQDIISTQNLPHLVQFVLCKSINY